MGPSQVVWATRVGAIFVGVCGLLALASPAMTWVQRFTALDLAGHGHAGLTSGWWAIGGWSDEARIEYLGAGFAYLCGIAMLTAGTVAVLASSRPTGRAVSLVALVSVTLLSFLLANGADGSPNGEEQGVGAYLWLLSSMAAVVVASIAAVVATRQGAETVLPRRLLPPAVITLLAGLVVLGWVLPPDPPQAPRLWPGVVGLTLFSIGLSAIFVVTRCAVDRR